MHNTLLKSLQTDFQEYLTAPGYGDFETKKQLALSHLSNNYGLNSNSRLEIYYDMYRLRLLDILFTDYPKLVGLMGEEKFTQAFLHYLLNYPSTHYSVRFFGEKLAVFLNEFEPFCFKQYYAEMAKFEWALSLTYDAADAESITFESLKLLPPEQWIDLKFKLHPSVSLISFSYNIVTVWKTLDAQKILPEQEDESVLEHYPEENPERLISPLSRPEIWLIWRNDLVSHFEEVNPEQYFMLEAINKDLSFAEVCEQLTKIMPSDKIASFVTHHLAKWLDRQILSKN